MSSESRKRYPSDLTDEQWALIEPSFPKRQLWSKGDRSRSVGMREVVKSILYQARSGCQWDKLPHDLLPKSTVYNYFKRLRDDGVFHRINATLTGAIGRLEAQSKSRFRAMQASIVSWSNPVNGAAHADSTRPANQRAKAQTAVDILGLLTVVLVSVASIDDVIGAQDVFGRAVKNAGARSGLPKFSYWLIRSDSEIALDRCAQPAPRVPCPPASMFTWLVAF